MTTEVFFQTIWKSPTWSFIIILVILKCVFSTKTLSYINTIQLSNQEINIGTLPPSPDSIQYLPVTLVAPFVGEGPGGQVSVVSPLTSNSSSVCPWLSWLGHFGGLPSVFHRQCPSIGVCLMFPCNSFVNFCRNHRSDAGFFLEHSIGWHKNSICAIT